MMKLIFCVILYVFSGVSPAYAGEGSEPSDLIIDAIQCAGNERTSCEVIKREIYLEPRDKIDEEELRNAKIRLKLLGLFKAVELSLKKGEVRGHVVVVVEVEEESSFFSETELGASYSSYSGFLVDLGFTVGDRNFLGEGKVLQATLTPLGLASSDQFRWDGSFEYIDPHVFGHKKYFYNIKIDYYFDEDAKNKVEGYDYESQTSAESDMTVNYQLGFGRRIFDFSHIGFSIVEARNNYYRSDGDPATPVTHNSGSWSYQILNYGWNSEDDTYFPTTGSKFDLNLYYNDDRFTSVFSQYKVTWAPQPKHIFSFYSDTRSYLPEPMDELYLSFEYGYQKKRDVDADEITDMIFFLKPRSRVYSTMDWPDDSIEAGIQLNSKTLGIVRLFTFLRIE